MSRNHVPSLFDNHAANPFFRSLQKEMNDVFNRVRAGQSSELFEPFRSVAFPALNISESDGHVEISAEVPGMSEKDVEVSVDGDMLVIKGEKSTETDKEEKDYRLVERTHGSFRRDIPLGFTPDAEGVSAELAEGVLKLVIARPASAKDAVKKVTIKKS